MNASNLPPELQQLIKSETELAEKARQALEQLKPVLEKLNDMCSCTGCGLVFANQDFLRLHCVFSSGRYYCPAETL